MLKDSGHPIPSFLWHDSSGENREGIQCCIVLDKKIKPGFLVKPGMTNV
jgi:hypothetical protein